MAEQPVRARGYWELVWRRFKRDRIALASGIFIAFVLLLCFVAEPLLERILGHGPNDIFPYAVNIGLKPAGPWTWVPDTSSTLPVTAHTPRTLFVLGADGQLGRDEFLRLLKGGQVSLEVALGATALALVLGATLGMVAGYYRGWVDSAVSRVTEFVMGFPLLLLIIAIGFTINQRFDSITLHHLFQPGVLSLVFVIGIFTWFYPARIIRAEVLRLRSADFVEAARMIGASDGRIVRSHLLPHLVGPMAVYATLTTAVNVVLEAAISFLNLGIKLPVASWGNMLSTNWGTLLLLDRPTWYAETSSWTSFWPTVTVLLTVLSLTLFGEGVREAYDPGARAR